MEYQKRAVGISVFVIVGIELSILHSETVLLLSPGLCEYVLIPSLLDSAAELDVMRFHWRKRVSL